MLFPICQHNILWEDLTAREHLRMFAFLKGVPSLQRKQEIKELLENVQLDDVSGWNWCELLVWHINPSGVYLSTLQVADHKVSTYSGGMKRRLSVALAFVGNPKVVFLGRYSMPMMYGAVYYVQYCTYTVVQCTYVRIYVHMYSIVWYSVLCTVQYSVGQCTIFFLFLFGVCIMCSVFVGMYAC